MAVRRSARTASKTSAASSTSAAAAPSYPKKKTRARNASGLVADATSTTKSAPVKKAKAPAAKGSVTKGAKPSRKRAVREPLSSRQTAEPSAPIDSSLEQDTSGDVDPPPPVETAVSVSEPPRAESAKPTVPALEDFLDDTMRHDEDEEEEDDGPDHKTMEIVASWRARGDSRPPASALPKRRDARAPTSSPLPPSSPLSHLPDEDDNRATSSHVGKTRQRAPSMISLSEFNPPSPQQEARFHDADESLVLDPGLPPHSPTHPHDDDFPAAADETAPGNDTSFDSILGTDDFGFFAAQGRIHAKLDKEKEQAQAQGAKKTRMTRRSSGLGGGAGEVSFSGRPAFATPFLKQRKDANVDDEEENADGASPETSLASKKRSRRQKRNDAAANDDDSDEGDELTFPKPKAKRGRPRKGSASAGPSSARGPSSRAAAASGARKTSASSTGTRSTRAATTSTKRKKKTAAAGDEDEEIDLAAVESSDDEEDLSPREKRVEAKSGRIAEWNVLDDYELEVEDVIVF